MLPSETPNRMSPMALDLKNESDTDCLSASKYRNMHQDGNEYWIRRNDENILKEERSKRIKHAFNYTNGLQTVTWAMKTATITT